MSCGCQSPHFHLSLSQCLPSIPCFLNLSSFFFFSSAHPSICLYQSSWGNALLQRATEVFVTLLYNHPPCSDAASPFVDIQKKRLFYSKHFVADFSSRSCLESIVSHSTRMWKVFPWKHGVYITYTKRRQHLTTKWAPAEFWISYKVSYLKKQNNKKHH